MVPRPLTRREFVEVALALGAGAVLSACLPDPGAHRPPPPAPRPPHAVRAFESKERETLEAAIARLIPSDDLPGAREAGVIGFIERQLGTPNLAAFRRELVTGAAALDFVARASWGSPFIALAADDQDTVLRAIERGDGSTAEFSSRHFFAVLLALTLEGFLSDPSHGGNRDEAGWKVIGWSPRNPWLHGGDHG